MESLLNDLKERRWAVVFMVSTFLSLVVAADLVKLPETYGRTALKGNPIYYINFEEAFFMTDQGMDPYEESPYFKQNYLLFRILYCLRSWKVAMKLLHLFFVVCMGALFGQIVGGNKKYRTIFTAIMLINPITVVSDEQDLLLQGGSAVILSHHTDPGPDLLLTCQGKVLDCRSVVRHQCVLQSIGHDIRLGIVSNLLRQRQPQQAHVRPVRGCSRECLVGTVGSHRLVERERRSKLLCM